MKVIIRHRNSTLISTSIILSPTLSQRRARKKRNSKCNANLQSDQLNCQDSWVFKHCNPRRSRIPQRCKMMRDHTEMNNISRTKCIRGTDQLQKVIRNLHLKLVASSRKTKWNQLQQRTSSKILSLNRSMWNSPASRKWQQDNNKHHHNHHISSKLHNNSKNTL